jgi:hypothetical protein
MAIEFNICNGKFRHKKILKTPLHKFKYINILLAINAQLSY